MDRRVVFLPGAGGDGSYWRPVAALLPSRYEQVFINWPGLGAIPPDPHVTRVDDLVTLVVGHMDQPVELVAHSMGGVVAVRAALERPKMLKHLVLSATSGGVDLSRFRARDWRTAYREAHPMAPSWFLEYRADLSERIRTIEVPTLLLWGDADPISPVAVGEHLVSLFSRGQLVVIPGGTHTFARDRAPEVALYIASLLSVEEMAKVP